MSKRFKGDLCAYCSKVPSITGDHIFAREFFLQSARANLPQAPVCATCNNEKSKLEHYLATVLPFGGRHPDALENLSSMVPQRLRKNVKLHRQLLGGHSAENIPIEGAKLEELFGLIARGLIWYHWKIYLDDERHSVHTMVVTPTGARVFNDLAFRLKARDHVIESVGKGTFAYEGVQGTDDPSLAFWRFSIYGGLVVGDGQTSEPHASQIVAFTGPTALVRKLAQIGSHSV